MRASGYDLNDRWIGDSMDIPSGESATGHPPGKASIDNLSVDGGSTLAACAWMLASP